MPRLSTIIRTLVLLGLVVAQIGAAPVAAPQISDGQWRGVLSAVGSGTADAVVWAAHWDGSLEFVSASGTLEGDFIVAGRINTEIPNGSGEAVYAGNGLISGTASSPLMDLQDMAVDGTVVVFGVATPFSADLGPDDLRGTIQVTLISASCSTVTGDWTAPVMMNLAAQGIDSRLTGHWVANRIPAPGESSEEFDREIAGLLNAMMEWWTISFVSGFNFTPLMHITLDRAEQINRRLDRLSPCSGVDAEAFNTVLSGIIATIIRFALDHPQGMSLGDIMRLSSIGLRMGVLGEGASNPEWAADLEAGLLALANQRLEEIKDNPDCGLVSTNASLALAIAVLFGDGSLDAAATDVLIGGLTCSG